MKCIWSVTRLTGFLFSFISYKCGCSRLISFFLQLAMLFITMLFIIRELMLHSWSTQQRILRSIDKNPKIALIYYRKQILSRKFPLLVIRSLRMIDQHTRSFITIIWTYPQTVYNNTMKLYPWLLHPKLAPTVINYQKISRNDIDPIATESALKWTCQRARPQGGIFYRG